MNRGQNVVRVRDSSLTADTENLNPQSMSHEKEPGKAAWELSMAIPR
jgi:hypothetical protein